MKRSRFSEEQIIAILREQEAGTPTAEVCRRHGVSTATFYKWKAKFAGMGVSEAKRLAARLQRRTTPLTAQLDDPSGIPSPALHRRPGRCATPRLRAPASCNPGPRRIKSTPDSRFGWMKDGGHVTGIESVYPGDLVT